MKKLDNNTLKTIVGGKRGGVLPQLQVVLLWEHLVALEQQLLVQAWVT
ncbi:hypothetical protein QP705_08570 [Limosilactobacillus reuteri]|nr:hypothetical protein [Limosilactobacillus reuteri]MDK8117249.1 hypothetical protein [Limosilactobacillus reuteri]